MISAATRLTPRGTVGMRRFFSTVAIAVGLWLGASFSASGFFESAESLAVSCDGEVLQFSKCIAFLEGVSDGLKTLAAREQVKGLACVPGGARAGDLRSAFLEYLAANPHLADIAASSVAIDAFAHRWPCK